MRQGQRTPSSIRVSSQAGMSLSSLIITMGIGAIIAMVIGSLTRQMVHRKTDIDLADSLASIRGEITARIDCEETLSNARDSLSIGSNQDLCDAKRIVSDKFAGYDLSDSHPLRLIFKGKAANRFPTPDIDSSDKYAPFGENWMIQVGCDWAAKSLIIKAKPAKRDITGKQRGEVLLFADRGSAPPLCQRSLIDVPLPPPEPSKYRTSEVRYANTKESDQANYFEFDLDPKYRMAEIRIHGEWAGNGDSGADVMSENILIDLTSGKFSGAQLVKIGSYSKKSRVAIWKNASLTSSMTAPSLNLLKSGACNIHNDVYPSRCYPDQDYANKKFPQPALKCVQFQGNHCVKIRYESRIQNGDDGGSRWWALSIFIRKYY